jgi:hypothetical protein
VLLTIHYSVSARRSRPNAVQERATPLASVILLVLLFMRTRILVVLTYHTVIPPPRLLKNLQQCSMA